MKATLKKLQKNYTKKYLKELVSSLCIPDLAIISGGDSLGRN